jgi:hypothetical protein
LGWLGMVRVDGKMYQWMGDAAVPNVEQTAVEYTATKTIFTMNADGKVEIVVTFLSPITPDDLQRQSLTFSYMSVSVRSIDSNSHDVQVYSDITGGMQFEARCALALR